MISQVKVAHLFPCVCVCVYVTEARVAEDERRRRTRVEDSIEISGSSTATDKPYRCSVCVREHSDESKTLIDTCVTIRQKH